MGKVSRKVPESVRREILMEAGYRCAIPTCGHILTIDIHHIVWLKDGGGNDPSNLLALCPNCHALHTKGEIPQAAIRHWKGMLVALNHAFDRRGMDLLLLLNKQSEGIYYSADGLFQVAGLIAAGLVQQAAVVGGGLGPAGTADASIHQLILTERGKLLVEAWLAGDEDKYRGLLGGELSEGKEGDA